MISILLFVAAAFLLVFCIGLLADYVLGREPAPRKFHYDPLAVDECCLPRYSADPKNEPLSLDGDSHPHRSASDTAASTSPGVNTEPMLRGEPPTVAEPPQAPNSVTSSDDLTRSA